MPDFVPENYPTTMPTMDPLTGKPKAGRTGFKEDTDLRERVNEKAEAASKIWTHPCECQFKGCSCKVRLRFAEVCTYCLSQDHWLGLADRLEKIEERTKED
jgi:hypothetical protein